MPRLPLRIAAVLLFGTGALAAEEFVLRDSVGRSWRRELVTFEFAGDGEGLALTGPDGKTVPWQAVPRKSQKNLAMFLADLGPFETRTWKLAAGDASRETDLAVVETEGRIEIGNRHLAVALRTAPGADEGPIAGLRTAAGAWFGDSRVDGGRQPPKRTGYSASVVARGPVFAEVYCRAEYEGGGTWELLVRVIAGEPVALMEETFSLGADASMVLALGADFLEGKLLYRHGAGNVGQNAFGPARPASADPNARGGPEPVFVLQPWLEWWERERQGNWCGFSREKSDRMLAFGAIQAGTWVDPSKPRESRSAPRVVFAPEGGGVAARFPLRGGARRWMVMSLDRGQCEAVMKDAVEEGPRGPVAVKRCPLPQKYVIRHGDFPLDVVKDWILEWKGEDVAGGMLGAEAMDRFRARYKADPTALAKFRRGDVPDYLLDEAVACWVGTGDAELGRNLARQGAAGVQRVVDRFLEQEQACTMGVEPHRLANELLPAVNLAELALGGSDLTASDRKKLRAQLAFLRYAVGRADFFSPARGFSANPNMTTSVAAFQARLAGAIPSHPEAAGWMKGGLDELVRELHDWTDANGGWLEAPHYAMVALDTLIGSFLSTRNEALFDPEMKNVLEWAAKISTPPDARAGGRRHLPPIGNTPLGEPCGEFGIAAALWRDRDPEFSARLQWAHRQHGSFPTPGIGGFFPTLAGYRLLLLDPSLPEKAPAWSSELFPDTGAILRSGFPGDRETQLHLIAGANHAHYDDDSGSFTLWGKGRPLADDFGYSGVAAADDHNGVVTKAAGGGVMRVRDFGATERFDYLNGERGGWRRQVVFVKDADPLAPNYFVVADTLADDSPATWRLWFAEGRATLAPRSARFEGTEDTDLDVFFALPRDVELKAEERTRSSTGLRPDGSVVTPLSVTRPGISAAVTGRAVTAVLYPRLRTEAAPKFLVLAEGSVIRVTTAAGTDWVFLAPARFSYRDAEISFDGTAGLVSIRGDRVALALGAAGSVEARGHALKGEKPECREW